MTYRIAVHRCAACRGRGYRVRQIATMTLTTPCRQCDRTGKVHRWARR